MQDGKEWARRSPCSKRTAVHLYRLQQRPYTGANNPPSIGHSNCRGGGGGRYNDSTPVSNYNSLHRANGNDHSHTGRDFDAHALAAPTGAIGDPSNCHANAYTLISIVC